MKVLTFAGARFPVLNDDAFASWREKRDQLIYLFALTDSLKIANAARDVEVSACRSLVAAIGPENARKMARLAATIYEPENLAGKAQAEFFAAQVEAAIAEVDGN